MPSSPAAAQSRLLALQRATHATLGALGHELGDLSLSAAELNLLACLAGLGSPPTVTQLAACVGSRITTVSGVLDRLERRNYVSRAMHRRDRRAVRIELTATGRPVAARVRREFDAFERHALGGLPAQTIAAFDAALAAFTDASTELG